MAPVGQRGSAASGGGGEGRTRRAEERGGFGTQEPRFISITLVRLDGPCKQRLSLRAALILSGRSECGAARRSVSGTALPVARPHVRTPRPRPAAACKAGAVRFQSSSLDARKNFSYPPHASLPSRSASLSAPGQERQLGRRSCRRHRFLRTPVLFRSPLSHSVTRRGAAASLCQDNYRRGNARAQRSLGSAASERQDEGKLITCEEETRREQPEADMRAKSARAGATRRLKREHGEGKGGGGAFPLGGISVAFSSFYPNRPWSRLEWDSRRFFHSLQVVS